MAQTLKFPSAAFATMTFMKGYLVTMRPYLLFVSGVTGLAGMAFGEADAALFLACFLSYGFGQALTDCFQTDTDAISSPYRPLTRGAIPRTLTLLVSITGLIACISILAARNPWNLALGAAAGAGLATYTWFKRRWWGGPWYNAWIVLLLYCMASLAAGLSVARIDANFLWGAAGTFFGYANFVLAGYFKDIEADRATGYDTFPVRFGRGRSAVASDLLALGLAVSIAGTAAATGIERLAVSGAWIFLCGSAVALIAGQWNLHGNRSDANAHRAIIPVVHAYVAYLSGATLIQRPEWLGLLIGFYAAFWFVLSRRPEKGQV